MERFDGNQLHDIPFLWSHKTKKTLGNNFLVLIEY